MVMAVVWLVCAVLSGLNAGFLVSGVLEGRFMRDVGVAGYLQMHQPRDRLFRRLMPPLLMLLMLALLVLAALNWGRAEATLALLAFVLVLADVILTVRVMVPLNLRLQSFDASAPPAEAQTVRERWYAMNPIRTVLGVLAFVVVLLERA